MSNEEQETWPVVLNKDGSVTITYELWMNVARMLGYVNGVTERNGEPYAGYFDALKREAEPLNKVLGTMHID